MSSVLFFTVFFEGERHDLSKTGGFGRKPPPGKPVTFYECHPDDHAPAPSVRADFIGICRANIVKTHSCTVHLLHFCNLMIRSNVQADSKVYPVNELYLDEVAVGAPCLPEIAGFWSAANTKNPFSPMDVHGGKHDQPVGGPNMAPENWHRFGEATLYKQQQKMFQLWLGSDIPAWNSLEQVMRHLD